MSKRPDGVFPCRNDAGKGWWRCLPHRATHWEVRVKGKLVGRYTEKRAADLNYQQAGQRAKGRYRPYGFGRQMEVPAWRS